MGRGQVKIIKVHITLSNIFMSDTKELFKLIKDAKKIMITTHQTPDFDAIGSSIGLFWILKSLGKKNVDIIIEDEQPFDVDFLEGLSRVQNKKLPEAIKEFDLLFFLDANTITRFASRQIEFENHQKVIRIDHHASESDIDTTLDFVEEDTASTAEIVYKLFKKQADISQAAAKALFAGIYDDTRAFSLNGTNKSTLLIAADLVEKGVKVAEVAEYIFSYDESILNTVKVIINNLKFDKKLKYSYTYISRELYDFLKMDGTKMDVVIDLCINIMLGRKGYNWGFLVRPKSDTSTKISFRSRTDVQNVRKLAEELGGGGHDEAAGATLEDVTDPYEAIAIIRKKIEQYLKN